MSAPFPLFRNDLVRDGDQIGRVVDRQTDFVRVQWENGEAPTWHWSDTVTPMDAGRGPARLAQAGRGGERQGEARQATVWRCMERLG